jgi:two-component system sensor histidine kinase/response regulator
LHPRPVTVESGTAALEWLERKESEGRNFSLMLLDSQMSKVDGLELAAKIHRNAKFPTAIVMMLVAAGRSDDAARCQGTGIAACASKPIKESESLAAFLTALETHPSTV